MRTTALGYGVRWWGRVGVLWPMLLGLFTLWLLHNVPVAGAHEAVPGLIPLPAEDHDTAVVLQAFAVDLYLEEGDEAPVLRTEVRFRLYNTDKTRAARAHVRWSGTLQDGGALPALKLALGQDLDQASPYTQPAFVRTLRPDERLWVSVAYTETLPATLWTQVEYGVAQLAAWPTGVGSVRVTLHMPRQLDQRAMLHVAPEPAGYNGLVWEWQWEEAVPEQNVDAIFVRPEMWAQLAAWRQAAREGDVEAASELAQTLTDAVISPHTPEPVAEAFYPEAVALWSKVAEARPDDPEPWKALAALYAARAATSSESEAYRALRVAALRAAWERGARDEALREELAAGIAEEARAYAAANRWQEALQRVEQLAAVVGSQDAVEVRTLRREVALAWALESARVGDEAGFEQALQVGWGDELLGYFLPQRPPLRYVGVEVETTDTSRAITVTLTLDPDVRPDPRDTWKALTEYVATQLPQVEQTTREEGHTVTAVWRFSYKDPQDVLRVQQALTAALPETPAWTLVRAALRPVDLRRDRRGAWWGSWRTWREEVDLSAARQELEQAMQTVELSLATVPEGAVPEALWPVLRKRREADLAAWRALRDYSDVVYHQVWSRGVLPPLYRRWQLAPGERVTMAVTWPVVAPERIAVLAGGLLLAWTVLTWGVWRWLGRA